LIGDKNGKNETMQTITVDS